MADLYYVAMVESNLPEEFLQAKWPLHLTLIAKFALDINLATEIVDTVASKTPPISLVLGERAMFGANHSIAVRLVESNPELSKLHNDLLNGILSAGADIKKPKFNGEYFAPHITERQGIRHELPDSLVIDSVSMVHRLPEGNRQINSVHNLSGSLYEPASET